MKTLAWLVGLFALAVAGALAARLNDGYVLLVLPPWRVELSLNLAVLLMLLTVAILYLLVRGVAALFALPAKVAAYRAQVAREKSFRVFQDAFRNLFEGRYGRALSKAREAWEGGAAPGLAALVAARAAQRLRRNDDQNFWLEEASRIDPDVQAARWMLEAEMHLDNRDFTAALAALGHLQRSAGRHIAALRIELRARQGAGHWKEVLHIARQLEKRKALAPEVAGEVKLKAHRQLLGERASDTRALLGYLRDVPAEEMHVRLAREAVKALLGLEARDEAASVIESQLEREWDEELVALYGHCEGNQTTERIARAERWLPAHAHDAVLLLALARLCLARKLWGKAQSYIEASLSVTDTRDAHLELARLFDHLGRAGDADLHYRRAASLPTIP
jgi:HemY protein